MSSSETPPKLYAAQEPIFPKRVTGKFRNLKWIIMFLTLGVYYITPWIRLDRGPNLPDQAVLVDMAGRRFFFFWIEIWPHEFYFVAGLLIMAGLGLFLFTSALGRVWCGYTCPQTVWTDLFYTVERWVEGDRNARLRLWKAKWDFKKWRLRVTKWIVWLLIALATGGAWVFYFADAPTLLRELLTGQAAVVAYGTIAVLTATTFLFGGFLREQVCIYMCPWPRIQAAMMDEHSITVAYRDWRGEDRGKGKDRDGLGDCIDCNACVNVCPMGIDIRDGQQMECITCALCIDACDEIMDKTGRERGLIDYLALTDEAHEKSGEQKVPVLKHILRPRTLVYTTMWSLVGVGLIVALFIRSDIDLTVAAVRNPQFVTLSDGSIRNTYDIRIRNMTAENSVFRIGLTSDEILRVSLEGSDDLMVEVAADETFLQRVYVIARPDDPAALGERTDLRFWVEEVQSSERAYQDQSFFGSGQQ